MKYSGVCTCSYYAQNHTVTLNANQNPCDAQRSLVLRITVKKIRFAMMPDSSETTYHTG